MADTGPNSTGNLKRVRAFFRRKFGGWINRRIPPSRSVTLDQRRIFIFPTGVGFFHRIGLDYVSCSPFRVPVARLAAAHAELGLL